MMDKVTKELWPDIGHATEGKPGVNVRVHNNRNQKWRKVAKEGRLR
jgi:hypothetical protein